MTMEQSINEMTLQQLFSTVAKEFNVPEPILLSVSYNLTRWESHNGEPSTSGGYGPMHLLTINGVMRAESDQENNTSPLEVAANLLKESPDTLKKSVYQNIRGGAALLAKYVKETTGGIPENDSDWYGAVAKYYPSNQEVHAEDFANRVYQSINQGEERTTLEGERMYLPPKEVKPNLNTFKRTQQSNGQNKAADCPSDLACHFVPAFHQQKSENPSNYGNYDVADRPIFGPDIRYIVIHDAEGSYDGTIEWFANPASGVSAHYVIRSSDGDITQMVDTKDVPWHAGNWYFGMHSIGIEHEGHALEGATWYSEPMYRASAKLVRYLAEKYNIPLDRAHIFGHEEIPGVNQSRQTGMHWDPGPFWDWDHYMELVGSTAISNNNSGNIVTIKLDFKTNNQTISDADPTVQPANFVYLYEQPTFESPLFPDPALGLGTQTACHWGDKLLTGTSFYLAEQEGDWNAIWFAGKKAWFYNPQNQYTINTKGTIITPKKGKKEIDVYGAAYPEMSAYPKDITPDKINPLQYKISEGQFYVAVEKMKADSYIAKVFSESPYGVNTMILGNDEYYRIHFNHRFGFVKASDVDVVDLEEPTAPTNL
ncbi:negative regulator [Paenibacillus popilliae ATCC 14706]|uniref:N-acetylmuramoyl-L-alanine amidase n=2 Tax=Paenibacillus popilliae TaxID=78057 RepID=M9M219_PAEPP|nr:negative regulator [Paenibacillus popilliae ATCC 14706]